MAMIPGLAAMPGVLLNSVLGLLPDRTISVRSRDRVTVVAPMYNEEYGARRCLASILNQTDLPERVVISINGGSDDTYGSLTPLLNKYRYRMTDARMQHDIGASVETWAMREGGTEVLLVVYDSRTAKSESVNNLVSSGIVTSERLLLVDGDTILHPEFIATLRHNFYRLRYRKGQAVIEDYGLVSGSVRSILPAGAGLWQKVVSYGRRAEYAFSTMIRRGQASLHGDSELFGNSRLFTVVGCGFAMRTELLPMPDDSRTEDHEFTLGTQAGRIRERMVTPEAVSEMGLEVLHRGEWVDPRSFFGPHEDITLRRSGNARFAPEALMLTEDPANLNGFLNQVERWNGGGIEAALKRLGTKLPANVAWTVWFAQIENLIGISLLLVLLPVMVALNLGNPSIGMTARSFLLWLVFDLSLSLVLNTAGFMLTRRVRGVSWPVALVQSLGMSLLTLLPYILIRYLGPFTYVAALTDIIPARIRRSLKGRRNPAGNAAWERPRAARASFRTKGAMVTLMAVVPLVAGFVVAPRVMPVNAGGWELTYRSVPVHMEQYAWTDRPVATRTGVVCAVSDGWTHAVPATATLMGDSDLYRPLSLWDVLTLGRLAPLLPIVEDAAGAFGVPVTDLLQVFINESLLDPLAHGPTGDLGLAQLTSDALTLLVAASADPASVIYSPGLVSEESNVFDPVFSSCAGAAKLAWAYDQPGVTNLEEAYALYINPVHGFVNNRIGDQWIPLVAQMSRLEADVGRIANAYARYTVDPSSMPATERELIRISFDMRSGTEDLSGAYGRALASISAAMIDDRDFYRRVLDQLYGDPVLAVSL